MPGMSGFEALPTIKSLYPKTQVVIPTVFDDDERVFQALRTHIRNVYDKLHVNSKTEAILKAMKEGWT